MTCDNGNAFHNTHNVSPATYSKFLGRSAILPSLHVVFQGTAPGHQTRHHRIQRQLARGHVPGGVINRLLCDRAKKAEAISQNHRK